jgi:hypothetical protein
MPDILRRVGIKAPSDRVYAALSEEKGLTGWWTKNVKASPTVGAVNRFRFGCPPLFFALARARVIEGRENNAVYEEFELLALRSKVNGWLRRQGLQRFVLTPRT